jgi:aerobic-type carbon monoxide dehydrogenase small subunit (CoxS/CutS family)
MEKAFSIIIQKYLRLKIDLETLRLTYKKGMNGKCTIILNGD